MLRPQSVLRTILAFVAAPIVPLALFTALMLAPLLLQKAPTLENLGQIASGIGLIFSIGLTISYVVILIVAVPEYFILRHFGWLNCVVVIASAAALAALIVVGPNVYTHVMAARSGSTFSYFGGGCQIVDENVLTWCGTWILALNTLVMAALGAVGGSVFWLVLQGWGRCRPSHL